jgi:hypothetical protein
MSSDLSLSNEAAEIPGKAERKVRLISSCERENEGAYLACRTNESLVPMPSPHLCSSRSLLRGWLLPISQHLPNCTLPLPLQLVIKPLNLILSRRRPAPNRWLSSLILRIVRNKLIIFDFPQHQPSQIPASVALRISIHPPLRFLDAVRAERAATR